MQPTPCASTNSVFFIVIYLILPVTVTADRAPLAAGTPAPS